MPRAVGVARLPPVNDLRAHLKPVAWLALVAMLALAVLPTVSRALSFGGMNGWTENAAHAGMHGAGHDHGQHAGAQAQHAGHLEHCPLCALSFAAVTLPPAPSAAPALTLLRFEPPPLFLRAPRTLFAWRSAQPRGPPRLS